ncbi:hypothetical protein F2Q69_00013753 [Brassica cretica]|uniref:Uncharacterized protein n=1 Tax=Brassica cretica TaxID=69181 RepID=A0A8S9QYD3_BRACR|nr:hypothetical protein F2Q69_00013753 [Brassica cretica]
MPFTNQEIFSSREFRPPEKLEMANLLSDEPKINSIMPKNLSCFLVSHIQVNTSSNRWTCKSYQATMSEPLFGGLVSHIKHHWSQEYRRPSATFVRPFNPSSSPSGVHIQTELVECFVPRVLQVVSEPLFWYLLNHSIFSSSISS